MSIIVCLVPVRDNPSRHSTFTQYSRRNSREFVFLYINRTKCILRITIFRKDASGRIMCSAMKCSRRYVLFCSGRKN